MFKTISDPRYYNLDSHRFLWTNGALTNEWFEEFRLNNTNSRTTERQVPGWSLRMIRGEYAGTYLTGVKRRVILVRPNVYVKRSNFGTIQENMITGAIFRIDWPQTPPAGDLQLANNQGIIGFVKKAREATRALQGIVAAGELAETLKMIRSPAKALRKRIDDYARSTRRRVYRHKPSVRRKVVANSWLEASFGWKPLINDIRDGARYAAELGSRPPPFQYIEYTGKAFSQGSQGSASDNVTLFSWKYDILNQYESDVTYRGVIRNIVDAAGFRRSQDLAGYRWEDAIPSAWELIPYSFLVDYFTNIGDVLSCLSFNETNVGWMMRTTRTVGKSTSSNFQLNPMPETPTQFTISKRLNPGLLILTNESVTRQRYMGKLLPDFQWQLPGYGSLKWLNIAALAKIRFW